MSNAAVPVEVGGQRAHAPSLAADAAWAVMSVKWAVASLR